MFNALERTMLSLTTLLNFSALAGVVISAPSLTGSGLGPTLKLATSPTVDGALSYVEDSGVCETTSASTSGEHAFVNTDALRRPGVKQYSGYVEIGRNQSLWFWFFEARNNPEKAPFALWLNVRLSRTPFRLS